MFNTLKANGVPTAYLPFEGEHHGFRMADTIKRCLSAEFFFYSRIFGFEPADDLEPITIENLDPPPTPIDPENGSGESSVSRHLRNRLPEFP